MTHTPLTRPPRGCSVFPSVRNTPRMWFDRVFPRPVRSKDSFQHSAVSTQLWGLHDPLLAECRRLSADSPELMPHDLPKSYEPGAIETRWAEYWVKEKLFSVVTPSKAPTTANADGPAYEHAGGGARATQAET